MALGMEDSESTERGRVSVAPSKGFVVTHSVARIVQRALTYLRAGYPVHLCGPTGTGKTTLAFHVAAEMGRPIVLLHGDHQLSSADLVGSPSGTRTSRIVDNYVRSVVRMEEEKRELWVDNRLTTACRYGHTLIYDEFNRSTAEANNPLLSVFSEGILNLPKASDGRESYIRVHPEFTAVLTSNPEEYAGVFRAPDALLDRVVTIHLDYYDADTEASIVAARAQIDMVLAVRIVTMVRALRASNNPRARATVRGAISIGKILATSGIQPVQEDGLFREVCIDILGADPFLCSSFEVAGSKEHTEGLSAVSNEPQRMEVTEEDAVVSPAGRAALQLYDEHEPSIQFENVARVLESPADQDFSQTQDGEPTRQDTVRRVPRRGRKKSRPVADWLHALDRSQESDV